MPIVLREGAVTLRPFAPEDLDRLWAEETRDRGSFEAPWAVDDEQAKARVRARVEHSGTWRDQRVLDLAVEVDGQLVGDVQARRDPSYEPPGLFDLGIGLFQDFRGRGVGTAAITLITDFLFEEERAERVSLSTDVANAPMRRVAEKAGFSLEGIMRGFWHVSDGPARDYALYGRTRSDHGS
jgi:RimJ/RimL family protein N-acetyltransferase